MFALRELLSDVLAEALLCGGALLLRLLLITATLHLFSPLSGTFNRSSPMRVQTFLDQLRRAGGLLGRALERLQQASDLDLAATLRDGLVALASGASVRELADLLEAALEDAIDWRELVPGPIGQLIERAEDVPLRLAALQLARKLTAQWQRLDEAGRLSWLESLLPARA